MRAMLVIVLAAASTAYAAGRGPVRPSDGGANGTADPPRATAADTTVSPGLLESGSRIFRGRGCGSCHTVGAGPMVGPDLAGVTARRDAGWFRAMVTRPDSMLRDDPLARKLHERYPARMPDLGLDAAEADALWAFLALADEPAAFAEDGSAAPERSGEGPAACPHRRGHRAHERCPHGRCRHGIGRDRPPGGG